MDATYQRRYWGRPSTGAATLAKIDNGDLLTRDAVQELLGFTVSRPTFLKWERAGLLKPIRKKGLRRVLYRRVDVARNFGLAHRAANDV